MIDIVTDYSKIPDLPVIEHIVSQSPPRTVGRNDGQGSDLEATATEILQVQSMVQALFKPSIDDEVLLSLWQTLAKIFGSLSSRFSDIGWYVGALRMSYHDVQIRCALANSQSYPTPADLSRSSIIPAAPPYHVELLDAIAKLLHHRSVNSAHLNCFNDARKASKEAIRIQSELCIHEPENVEFKSTLSWMKRYFASIRCRDGAYDAVAFDTIKRRVLPADTTKFDEVRAVLRLLLQVYSTIIAIFLLPAGWWITGGTVLATGWSIGEYLSFINRRS